MRAIALNPDNPTAWNNNVGILGALRRYDEALAAAEHAIALDPVNAEVWTNKGSVLTYLGRTEEALQAFDHAIELDPNAHRPWGEKALVLIGRSDSSAALACAERAIARNANVGQYWLIQATALVFLGRVPDAIVSLDRCLALEPGNVAAIELREKALGHNPSPAHNPPPTAPVNVGNPAIQNGPPTLGSLELEARQVGMMLMQRESAAAIQLAIKRYANALAIYDEIIQTILSSVMRFKNTGHLPPGLRAEFGMRYLTAWHYKSLIFTALGQKKQAKEAKKITQQPPPF